MLKIEHPFFIVELTAKKYKGRIIFAEFDDQEINDLIIKKKL